MNCSRECIHYANALKRGGATRAKSNYSFGQPSGGRFFSNDRLIAACQLPSIFNISGLGPVRLPLRFFLHGVDFISQPHQHTAAACLPHS